MEDIIIIGSGPVGLYASTLAALHGLKGILIEGLSATGGQLTALYPEKEIVDLPGFSSISAKDFIGRILEQQQNQKHAMPVHLDEKAESFQKAEGGFLLKTDRGTYETKTILFATGMGTFSPRKTGLEGEDSYENIIYSIRDTKALQGKKIVILGGGDSAVDWAIALSEIASISIVHRREEFRAQSASVLRMESKGVEILKPYQVVALNGVKNRLESITIEDENKNVKQLPLDFLFVNYGMIAAPTSFPMEKAMNSFKVDTFCMTSEENIFAIGNACFYPGKVKNITSGLGEAVTAITKIDQIVHPGKNIPIHF